MNPKAILTTAFVFICCFTLTAESQKTGNGDKGKGDRGGKGKGKGNGGVICHDTIKDTLMQLARETPETNSFSIQGKYSLVPLYLSIANGYIQTTENTEAEAFVLSGMTEDDGTKKFVLTYNPRACENPNLKTQLKTYIEKFADSISYGRSGQK